ncbi:MAG: hypothetical protein SFU56_03975, partial [Capsulimonadales bacterium]|nr:hypothetical protein [Capsulimonadales bacterium]
MPTFPDYDVWADDWFRKWFFNSEGDKVDEKYRQMRDMAHVLEIAFRQCFGSTDGLYPSHGEWHFSIEGYLPSRFLPSPFPQEFVDELNATWFFIIEYLGEVALQSEVDARIRFRSRLFHINTHWQAAYDESVERTARRIETLNVVRLHRTTTVNPRAVPEQDHLARYLTQQMPQETHDRHAVKGLLPNPGHQLSRHRYRTGDRQMLVLGRRRKRG